MCTEDLVAHGQLELPTAAAPWARPVEGYKNICIFSTPAQLTGKALCQLQGLRETKY